MKPLHLGITLERKRFLVVGFLLLAKAQCSLLIVHFVKVGKNNNQKIGHLYNIYIIGYIIYLSYLEIFTQNPNNQSKTLLLSRLGALIILRL